MTDSVKPCPFCNFQVEEDDGDFCYPISRDLDVWNANCYQSGGGCGAQGPYAPTREQAIAAWNHRGGPKLVFPRPPRAAKRAQGRTRE